MKLLLVIVALVVSLLVLGWLGLQTQPKPFPRYAESTPALNTVALPEGLPAPVERFYHAVYGDKVPVIETAVVSGRGSMRLASLNVPIRFRFTHEAGQNYRHDVDLTFFGMPLLHGYETFIDGVGFGRTPGGVDQGEGFNQGSNVSLWAEALNWFPAVLVTDPRVEWRSVDDATALLIVPLGMSQKEVLVVRFDPETNLVQYVEAMKYKSAAHKKVLWNNGTWADEGRPWLHLNVESIVYNVDVRDYIRESDS